MHSYRTSNLMTLRICLLAYQTIFHVSLFQIVYKFIFCECYHLCCHVLFNLVHTMKSPFWKATLTVGKGKHRSEINLEYRELKKLSWRDVLRKGRTQDVGNGRANCRDEAGSHHLFAAVENTCMMSKTVNMPSSLPRLFHVFFGRGNLGNIH